MAVKHGNSTQPTAGRGALFDNGIETRLTLTSTEVARLLDLGRSTFYRKVASGEIDIPSINLGGERRYLLDTVKDWLKGLEEGVPRKRSYRKWQ